MIYQIYGFNIVCNRMIEPLKEYMSETYDNELPAVFVSEVNDLRNDISNSFKVSVDYADISFLDQMCFFELFDGVKIKITHDSISLCKERIHDNRIGEELSGPSIIALSRYHKRAVLHGSAFLYRGKAYLVLAYPGAGKSTLSTAMVRYHEDITFLTDDIICVGEDGKAIFRGIHSVNLNDDSLRGLKMSGYHNRKVKPCINIKSDKTTCDLNSQDKAKRQNRIPLGGIILLSEPIDSGMIRIQELDTMQSFCEMMKNIKMRKMMTSNLLMQEMGIINKMICQNVFVIRLQIEHDYAKLEAITNMLKGFIDGSN